MSDEKLTMEQAYQAGIATLDTRGWTQVIAPELRRMKEEATYALIYSDDSDPTARAEQRAVARIIDELLGLREKFATALTLANEDREDVVNSAVQQS